MQAIGKAAAEEAAWAKLQRSAAWWLGEYGNVAAEESSGSIQAVRSAASIEAALQQKTSAAELMALQVRLCTCRLQAGACTILTGCHAALLSATAESHSCLQTDSFYTPAIGPLMSRLTWMPCRRCAILPWQQCCLTFSIQP